MKKWTIILLFLMTAFAFTGCNVDGTKAEESTKESITEDTNAGNEDDKTEKEEVTTITDPIEAFDFTVEKTDGTTFTLSEQKGKVVFLNFWATWCGPCVYEMPILEQLYEEYKEEDVEIITVNCMEDKKTVDAFVEETGYTFPIAYDETGEVGALYYVSGIPFTVVVDKEGVIRQTFSGVSTLEEQYKAYKNVIEILRAEE